MWWSYAKILAIWLHQEIPCESPRNCPAALKRGVGSKPLVVIQRCKVGRSTWTSIRHVFADNRITWWRERPNKEQLAFLPKNLPMSCTIFLEASKGLQDFVSKTHSTSTTGTTGTCILLVPATFTIKAKQLEFLGDATKCLNIEGTRGTHTNFSL